MKTIVSVEFTTDFIRAAEVAKPHGSHPTVLRYAEVHLAPGVVGDSEVFDTEVASEALKELWELGKFKTKMVSLGISSRRIMVRDYDAPYIDLEKIKETLTFEAADLLPSQMENSVLDFYPVEKIEINGKAQARGLLVATAAEPLENVVAAITLAGLTVEYVDLVPFGLARAGRRLINHEEEYFIVNVRTYSSEVIAVKEGAPRMVRTVPNGIDMRNQSGAGKHRGVADQNLSLDVNQGSPTINAVDSFIGALRATLNYYEGRGGKVQKIYLCGEGALNSELQEKILPQMGLPGRVLDLESLVGPPKQEVRDQLIEASLVATVASALRSGK